MRALVKSCIVGVLGTDDVDGIAVIAASLLLLHLQPAMVSIRLDWSLAGRSVAYMHFKAL